MPGLVHVEAAIAVAFEIGLQAALEQAELDQARRQGAHGGRVVGLERLARTHLFDRRKLGGKHDVIDGPLLRRIAAIDRKRARDVGGVTGIFGTGIDQQQVAIAQHRVVGAIVEDAAIRAAADDRLVTRHRTVLAEGVQEFGFDLVLVHAGPRCAHGASMGLGGDLRGFAHQAQFATRLVQAQVVQQV